VLAGRQVGNPRQVQGPVVVVRGKIILAKHGSRPQGKRISYERRRENCQDTW
jgi:hypothetical protein